MSDGAPPAGVDRLLAAARARLDRMAPTDLAAAAAAGALVIDIRPEADRAAEGALPEAMVIDRNVLEWRLDPGGAHRIPDAADPERLVVLVCNEGYQSSLAAAALQDVGLTNATDLIGGYRAWRAAAGGAAASDVEHAGRDLSGLREDYRQNGLRRADLDPDPFVQFRAWFDVWAATDPYDANAMVLATADATVQPSARYVLLKGLDDGGFVFYTNRRSRKGDALAENAKAALCFGWLDLARQVRVEGSVTEVDDAESDAYFASRPRGSQLGAAVSQQSSVIAGRDVLEADLAQVTREFEGRDVTRPPHWGGYRLHPEVIEFWQGRANRLHDRLRYRRDASTETGWRIERLAP